METLWIIYYWFYIPVENKKNISASVDFICLDEKPGEGLFREEVERHEGEFKADNPSHKAEIICKISVRRIKYEDERFEHLGLCVYKMENGQEKYLGMVITDIISLSNDIYQVIQMGPGLVKKECGKIVQIIEDNFYRLKTVNESKINNPYIIESFDILKNVYEEYMEYLKTTGGKEGQDNCRVKDGLWENYGYEEARGQFFIPVKDFKEMYENMDISREMGITGYKKLLSRNGYSMTNRGRNDYTHAENGKVIALYIEKIKEGLKQYNGR